MAKKLSKAQMEVLSRLAGHCEIVRWKFGRVWRAYGLHSYGFKPAFKTMLRLEQFGYIVVKDYSEHGDNAYHNDYVATLTPAGRAALAQAQEGK